MKIRHIADSLAQRLGFASVAAFLPQDGMRALQLRLLAAAFLLLVPIYAMVIFTFSEQRERAIQRATEQTIVLTEIVSLTHESYLVATSQLLSVLAELPAVRMRDLDTCQQFFTRLVELHPLYSDISAADNEGNIFCTTPPVESTSISEKAYFKRAMETRALSIGDFESATSSEAARLSFAYPFIGPRGVPDGVVTAAIDLGWLNDLASNLPLPEGTALLHVDSNGTLLARYPETEGWIGKNVAEFPAVVEAIKEGQIGSVTTMGIDGRERLYSYRPLEGGSGSATYLLVGFDTDELFSVPNQIFLRNVSALVFVTILALLLTWFASRKMLVERIEHAQEITRLQSEFVSFASHQLRNPVSAIRLYSDMLTREKKPLSDAERERAFSGLRKATDQLSLLTVDLLEAGRAESGVVELERERIDLSALLRDVADDFEAQRNAKSIALIWDVPEQLDPLWSDQRILRHVFQNLLSNAIKYTPEEGKITVAVDAESARYRIRVRDTGIGVPEEERERLFARFFRASNVRDSGAEGTGLGLHIAKSLIERLGGTLDFAPAQGQGTEFWFTIPRDSRR